MQKSQFTDEQIVAILSLPSYPFFTTGRKGRQDCRQSLPPAQHYRKPEGRKDRRPAMPHSRNRTHRRRQKSRGSKTNIRASVSATSKRCSGLAVITSTASAGSVPGAEAGFKCRSDRRSAEWQQGAAFLVRRSGLTIFGATNSKRMACCLGAGGTCWTSWAS